MQSSITIIRPAAPPDLPQLLALLRVKAEFDGGVDLLRATRDELRSALFGNPPRCEVLVAEDDSELLALATYFATFSTYLA